MPSPRLEQQVREPPAGPETDPGGPRVSRSYGEEVQMMPDAGYPGGFYPNPQTPPPKPGAGAGDLDLDAPQVNPQPAPKMPPKTPPKSNSVGDMRKGLPAFHRQYFVGLIEIIKLVDWFTELLKVLCGKDAAGEYFPWAVFTLVMASWLLLHRAFDQVGLLVLATGWAGEYLCCLMGATCPFAFVFFPLANLTFCLYRKEHPNAVHDERAIFAQRPLSTIMLGLPFSGVMSMFVADAELVMHPAQVHIRAMQAMYQTIFLNIPDFVVDLIIILNAAEDTNVGWFYVSFLYSVMELMTVCLMTVRHIHEAEKKKPIPPRQAAYRY